MMFYAQSTITIISGRETETVTERQKETEIERHTERERERDPQKERIRQTKMARVSVRTVAARQSIGYSMARLVSQSSLLYHPAFAGRDRREAVQVLHVPAQHHCY